MSPADSPSIFITPQTPPRPERRRSNATAATPFQSNPLLTPSTATKKQAKSPVAIRRKQDTLLTGKFPFTPATPQKSPSKSKKNLDLFISNNEKFGILLPSPSTIGSGRCHNSTLSQGPPPPVFDMKKLNEFKVPGTPKRQIITEPTLPESDDEDDWELTTMSEVDKIPRANVSNPFIDNGESRPTAPAPSHHNGINYDTHMELINNKTGKKRIVKLTKNQMKIKPKKLSFDGI
ncbi:hypothetical protein Cantr_04795 [Candida viswanathii]|uniref:Uncharacterized protein n=1 Tax=Candida viswanathii TaxID=5486 RepID=A0A367XNS5_9ASCO|nr:hypothetical protein Cantr_04795 [Candida viswanathii]